MRTLAVMHPSLLVFVWAGSCPSRRVYDVALAIDLVMSPVVSFLAAMHLIRDFVNFQQIVRLGKFLRNIASFNSYSEIMT